MLSPNSCAVAPFKSVAHIWLAFTSNVLAYLVRTSLRSAPILLITSPNSFWCLCVIRHLGRNELPLKPSPHTIEMMAKAAVAVYEAAAEEHKRRKDE